MGLVFNFIFWLAVIVFASAFFMHTKAGSDVVAEVVKFTGWHVVEKNIAERRDSSKVAREKASNQAAKNSSSIPKVDSLTISVELAEESSRKASELQDRLRDRQSQSAQQQNTNLLSERMDAIQDRLRAAEERSDSMRERMMAQKSRNDENMARLRERLNKIK